MYNVNFNISGDLHIHIGNSDLDSLFPDEMAEEDDCASVENEDFESDIPGLIVSVEGLPADVDREAVESIIAVAVELLNAEVRETMANRKDDACEKG